MIRFARTGVVLALVASASVLIASPPAAADPIDVLPAGTMTYLDQSTGGSWCWFEDERVLIDRSGTRLYAGVNTSIESAGTARVLELDMTSGSRRIVDLGRAEVDDHNTPAVWEAPNGEILTSWSRHSKDPLLRQNRRLTNGTWTAQPPVVAPSNVTYNNLYSVDGGNLLYDFYRGGGYDPQVQTSTDGGRTWTYRGRLLRDPEDRNDRRPYVKYTSNGTDRIDFMATPSHPRESATEIYAGYIKNDTVYRSDGTALGPVGSSIDVSQLTLVWAPPNEQEDGWDVDLTDDPITGRPVMIFVRNIAFEDNRYYYAKWAGTAWQVDEIAYGGTSLYAGEPNYAGLATIDPTDTNTVVISTDADPSTGEPLSSTADGMRHRELYKGTRQPNHTFSWAPMTSDSSVDNIRPVWTASESGADALLWLRGRYSSYRDFSLSVVGIVLRADDSTVAPGTIANPVEGADAAVTAGNFDSHETGDLFLNRPGSGPEELRLFDKVGGVSRVLVQPGYDDDVPVVGDFTGDGQSDVYWYGAGDVAEHLWTQLSSAFIDSTPTQVHGTYQPLVGDFDGNGRDDIYWYAPGTARDALWLSSSTGFVNTTAAQVIGVYTPIVGDFDGNGRDDIFWYAPGTAADSVWYSSTVVFSVRVAVRVTGSYAPVAGNFDGLKGTDIYWYSQSGTDPLWRGKNRAWIQDQGRPMGPLPVGGHNPVATNVDASGGDDLVWFVAGGPDAIWESHTTPFDVVRTVQL